MIYILDIDNNKWWWTDEMFEDDEPQVSDQLIKDIAEVIKSHNLGVSVSENEGKLIIEPMTAKDGLAVDTPCMVKGRLDKVFQLRYYAGNGRVVSCGQRSSETDETSRYDIVISWSISTPTTSKNHSSITS